MARSRGSLRARKRPNYSGQRHQATWFRGIKPERPQRRSERISKLQRSLDDREPEQRRASLSAEELQDQPLPLPSKHRKRLRESEEPSNNILTGRPPKRRQPSPPSPSCRQKFDHEAVSGLSISQRSHISHWVAIKDWPKEYFQENKMHHLLARQRSTPSLRRKRSEASLIPSETPSDQKPREEKSAPYRNSSYVTLLETLGNSYMDDSELGVTDTSESLCEDLLKRECIVPKDTLFRDDVFRKACRNLREKNEAKIILDIHRLLAPSPETLAAFGATNFDILVESVNEGWNNSIPITSTRPQPDFAVGFRRSMLSDDQLRKIHPLLGDPSSLSYFRATHYMYFPFLTCEVKCGAIGLNIADRQNAHSMTLAVRGLVELFKLAKRENELHRELLTFSISHDERTVRLYGHYPILDGSKTKIYRYQIHTFDITALGGKERWTAYKFTVAVYNHSLTLLKRICSVIDELPSDFDLKISQRSLPQLSEHSGLSQQLENHELAEEPDSQSSRVDLQQVTPDTSTQAERLASKKKKAQ